jgi:uncharacterized OB-fold protein
MMMTDKRKTPVREGLWIESIEADKKPYLLGSKCSTCGEVYFPKKMNMTCTWCQSTTLTDIFLSTRGVVHTHTTVMVRPPGDYYKGKVPYTIGVIELPEGVYVETLFTDCDFDKIKIGMPVELTIEKLYDYEEDEVMTYKFRPISSVTEA